MSTTELKSVLHQPINSLQKEEDLQDLLLTISEFVSYHTDVFTETPELKAQLEKALKSVTAGRLTPHKDVVIEAKQWLIR